MSDKIFQYAILLHPTEKEAEEEDKRSELVVDLQTVLAANEQAAIIHASRQIPEEYLEKLHRVEIAVRPF
jgi:hypothetical protein